MVRFRVQNYKKIEDTGWTTCGSITTFVGKNEAGKSATFRGLSKLNPSDGEKYDGLKEFPRRRYTAEFKQKDWPVSSVEFELSNNEVTVLAKICPLLSGLKSVTCTRYYSSTLAVRFEPTPEFSDFTIGMYLKQLLAWHSLLEKSTGSQDQNEALTKLKAALLPFLNERIKQLKAQSQKIDAAVSEQFVEEVETSVMAQFNEDWQQKKFKDIIENIQEVKGALESRKQLAEARQWVGNNLPKFVYFDRYDILESAVHIPTFIQALSGKTIATKVRTTKCLFEHVGLDVNTLQQLDPTQHEKEFSEQVRRLVDERSILMSSASSYMTDKFSEWWEQRKHKFRYDADGPYFRVWVSDDLDPSEIELDQRSAGMQYFFSFYLVFLVEAKGAHANAILLLDEPGLHVHGTAQQKIVKFLEKLSQENQLLYSTHSPFMVDGEHLERVRIVHEDKKDGTTRISEDAWPDDKDALFPLQAGLGYAIAQTLFYSKRQLVVEGLTDYWILKSLNHLLLKKGMITLKDNIIITPSGGIRNLMPLASMLIGHEINIAVLLDGDEPGAQKGKEVQNKLQVKCLFINNFIGKKRAELEDLFPENLYLEAVRQTYSDPKFTLSAEEEKMECIADRVQAAFKRLGKGDFEKWLAARILVDWIQDPSKESALADVLTKVESIFKEVNTLLK